MTKDQQADQARKGLIDSVKGKAKEVVGAVTGNDSLTAEGQLEQAQAHERRSAGVSEAVADAQTAQAEALANEAESEGDRSRLAATAQAADEKRSIRAEQDAQYRTAEEAGRQDAVRAREKAEDDAQKRIAQAKVDEDQQIRSAAKQWSDAVDDFGQAKGEADTLQDQANRLRERAQATTEESELP